MGVLKLKKLLKIFALFFILLLVMYIYARFIEPNRLNINYESLSSELIGKNDENIKIVQFSDIHLSDYFNINDLKKVVKNINAQNPDIVIFTGDLIDHYNNYSYKGDIDKIWEALGEIKAPLGKYAVYGNHDYGGGAERVYKKIMEKSNFILLVNDNVKLEQGNINIIGLDDAIFGSIDVDKVVKSIDDNYYNIIISHEPDIVEKYLEYSIDLFLAGHSHGGQVNIPFFSTNILPPLAEKYVSGIYKFENDRETIMYVNVGIGTSQVPLRFMAVPEIAVFNLKHK